MSRKLECALCRAMDMLGGSSGLSHQTHWKILESKMLAKRTSRRPRKTRKDDFPNAHKRNTAGRQKEY